MQQYIICDGNPKWYYKIYKHILCLLHFEFKDHKTK